MPLTVQTEDVVEAKFTVKPEVAVATRLIDEPVAINGLIGGNEIAWDAGVMLKALITSVAAG